MPAPAVASSHKVVYTAILGGVDLLARPESIDADWEYICFSDASIDCPPWRRAPVTQTQPTLARESRYLKVNAATVLPDAELSLWVDGNVVPVASPQALADRYLFDHALALHQHPQRGCVFDEAVAIIDQGKDAAETVMAQVLRYAREQMPQNVGVHATAAILRRHTPAIAALEQTWWHEIVRGSHRDQLSLPYALRAHDVSVATIDGDVWQGSLFRHRPHDGPNAPTKIKLPDGSKRLAVVPAPNRYDGAG